MVEPEEVMSALPMDREQLEANAMRKKYGRAVDLGVGKIGDARNVPVDSVDLARLLDGYEFWERAERERDESEESSRAVEGER
jgi:hypothetical protein